MSFRDAAKKEAWFHNALLKRTSHEAVLPKCGIGSLRSTLVEKYEAFATKSFVTDAPDGAPGE